MGVRGEGTPGEASARGRRPVLVTGVTGYVGGRLVPELLDRGHPVRVLTRSADRIRERPWIRDVDVVEGDASDPGTLERALAGVDTAYYLIHAMGQGRRFEDARPTHGPGIRRAAAERARSAGSSTSAASSPSTARALPAPALPQEVGRIFLDSASPPSDSRRR